VKTPARRFVTIELEAGDGGIPEEDIAAALGDKGVEGAVVKVRCTVREVDVSINEKGIRNALKGAFSVRVERILDSAGRATRAVELTKELDPVSALEKYIQHKPELKNISKEMIQCARRLIKEVEGEN